MASREARSFHVPLPIPVHVIRESTPFLPWGAGLGKSSVKSLTLQVNPCFYVLRNLESTTLGLCSISNTTLSWHWVFAWFLPSWAQAKKRLTWTLNYQSSLQVTSDFLKISSTLQLSPAQGTLLGSLVPLRATGEGR